jgi:hypothetical protein
MRLSTFCASLLLSAFFIVQLGCTGGPRPVPTQYIDPDGAAKKAMEMYDTNHDGKISGAELDKVPSLKFSLKQHNISLEKGCTADDIAKRIRTWADSKVGSMGFSCQVTKNGQPFQGAEVKFIPESFLGEGLKGGMGKSGGGMAAISAPIVNKDDPPGIPPGFYKVEINGKPTPYGVEVAPDIRYTETATFDIK